MKKIELRRLMLVAATAGLLAACGGGGGGDSSVSVPAPNTGTLRISLTDAPACGFDKVYVTVERVRVHQSPSIGESDTGWSEIVLVPARRVDLLSLTNGVLTELGQARVPVGKYQQLRLVLAENGGAAPFANAVLPTGSTDEVALTTPSAEQSGLKIKTDMDVFPDQTADFVIDFDACKSIVTTGGGKYLLKPVLTLARRTS